MSRICKRSLILYLSISWHVLILLICENSEAVLSTKHNFSGFPAINSSLFQVYKIGHFGSLACRFWRIWIVWKAVWKSRTSPFKKAEHRELRVICGIVFQKESTLAGQLLYKSNFNVIIIDSFGQIHWKKWSNIIRIHEKSFRNQRYARKSFKNILKGWIFFLKSHTFHWIPLNPKVKVKMPFFIEVKVWFSWMNLWRFSTLQPCHLEGIWRKIPWELDCWKSNWKTFMLVKEMQPKCWEVYVMFKSLGHVRLSKVIATFMNFCLLSEILTYFLWWLVSETPPRSFELAMRKTAGFYSENSWNSLHRLSIRWLNSSKPEEVFIHFRRFFLPSHFFYRKNHLWKKRVEMNLLQNDVSRTNPKVDRICT